MIETQPKELNYKMPNLPIFVGYRNIISRLDQVKFSIQFIIFDYVYYHDGAQFIDKLIHRITARFTEILQRN